jgi:hypothetical protein
MVSLYQLPKRARAAVLSRSAAPQITAAFAALALTGSIANASSIILDPDWKRPPAAHAVGSPSTKLAQVDEPASGLAETRDAAPSQESETRPVDNPAGARVGVDDGSQARADVAPENPARASSPGEPAGPGAGVIPSPAATGAASISSASSPDRTAPAQAHGPTHQLAAAQAPVVKRAPPVSRKLVQARANVCSTAASNSARRIAVPVHRPAPVLALESEPAPMAPLRSARERLGWGLPWSLARGGAAMVSSAVVWPFRYASGVLGL